MKALGLVIAAYVLLDSLLNAVNAQETIPALLALIQVVFAAGAVVLFWKFGDAIQDDVSEEAPTEQEENPKPLALLSA